MKNKKTDPDLVKKVFGENTVKFDCGYEHERWHHGELHQRDYRQTRAVIEHHTGNVDYGNMLEVGCGPGTWTKVLYREDADIVLLDITYKMLEIARNALGHDNIKYVCSNFDDPGVKNGRYDLFFSSRAFEYMDRNKSVKNAFEMLAEDGVAVIITKNPYVHNQLPWLLLQKLTFGAVGLSDLHRGQVPPGEMRDLMLEAGFSKARIYPVVYVFRTCFTRWKWVRKLRIWISDYFWTRYYKFPLKRRYLPLIESYIAIGEK